MPMKKLTPAGYAAAKALRDEKIKTFTEFTKLAQDPLLDAEKRSRMDTMRKAIEDMDERLTVVEKLDPGMETTENEEELRRIEEQRSKGGAVKRLPAMDPIEIRRYGGEDDRQFEARSRRATIEYERDWANWLGNKGRPNMELRAIQADDGSIGGTMVMPERMYGQVIKAVDNMLWVRSMGTVVECTDAAGLGIANIDSNPDDSAWTTEIETLQDDAGYKSGKRALIPVPLRKLVKVSEPWLRKAMAMPFKSADNTSGLGGGAYDQVKNRIAYTWANTQEKAFFTGHGIGQPLGIFANSTKGIPASRDVLTGSATGFTYLGLVNTKYSLKSQYYKRAVWGINRLGMAKLMVIVDNNGRPLLDFSRIPQQPDSLLGSPIHMSENIPSAFVSGSYVGFYGDMSFYMIADSMQMRIAVANELYLANNQVGFFANGEVDGMPVLAEAFARMKTS